MNYYKTGEFAKMANVSIRTLRYYDSRGLLIPSMVGENKYRFYTDQDLVKLQKILSLKFLGFSLDEIFALTIHDDNSNLSSSLKDQSRLIHQKIEQLLTIEQALLETSKHLEENKEIDWNMILNIIHLSNMDREIVNQYKSSENLDVRISLHKDYSTSPITWFDWLFKQYDFKEDDKILELGCGNGQLWIGKKVTQDVVLSDIFEGMVKDCKDTLQDTTHFTYQTFDMQNIPYEKESFDKIIANHVLFYAKDIDLTLQEVKRVLKKNGKFYCSTYGKEHMKELTELVKEFNPNISLSSQNLYDIFGLDNGEAILKKHFSKVTKITFEDSLLIDRIEPIINYILSCHGNQAEYINANYNEFRELVKNKLADQPFEITKDAGIFICEI